MEWNMMKIRDGGTLLMIGDSITDCGRAQPYGTARSGLGFGYVALVNAHLTAFHPERRIRVINVGTSGDTVRDLDRRWDTDVISHKPDVVTIMIGTNDVWRQFDSPHEKSGVPLDEYRATLTRLVKRTPVPRLLATPFFLEPLATDAMRARMDEYGYAVKEIAADNSLEFLDTQALFAEYLKNYHSSAIAWDRVHPDLTGHLLLARGFLSALGFGG